MKRVAIIGGGFAGLAAAVRLCDAGCPVALLERRQQLGGRAFSFSDPVTGDTLDNGQHLFMKCYRETLDVLTRIGARDDVVFQPRFGIAFRHATRGACDLRFPSFLPAPLNLLVGFLRFRAIRWSDIPPLRKIDAELHKALAPRLAVDAWLDHCGQTPRMRAAFWDPLCLAALNQRPHNARARHLQAVLREAFWQPDGACLGYARKGLSDLFAHRAREHILNRRGRNPIWNSHNIYRACQRGHPPPHALGKGAKNRGVHRGRSAPPTRQNALCQILCPTPSHPLSIRAIAHSFDRPLV